jgi:hypothetical protein
MFLTHWSTVFLLGCHDIVNRLYSHDVHTHTLNVRSVNESIWPDDGSIATETCFLLYLNQLYVSAVFRGTILFIILFNTTGWLLSKHKTKVLYDQYTTQITSLGLGLQQKGKVSQNME